MPLTNVKNQRGFTLIEMSIVLVIIGLIVGGILKGQELIESARQKNMASLYDQIKAAQNTFLDRYRALPGDYNRSATQINATVVNGDGNGFVGAAAAVALANAAAIEGADGTAAEPLHYFNGIIASGLFGGGQVAAAATAFSGGAVASPLPSGPWTLTGLTVAHGRHATSANAGDALTTVWLRLQSFAVTADPALTGAQTFQMDQKFDDGVPVSGRIRTSGVNTAAVCGGAVYSVIASTGVRECELLFSME